MAHRLENFWASEAGAVTVEYVLLIALVGALGAGTMFQVRLATSDLTNKIADAIETMEFDDFGSDGDSSDTPADDGSDDDNSDDGSDDHSSDDGSDDGADGHNSDNEDSPDD